MKVLIALDRSRAAQHAAQVASTLLAPVDAEFHVINVAELPLAWSGGYAYGATPPLDLPVAAPAYEADQVAIIGDEAEAAGIPEPDVEVVVGHTVAAICEAAERHAVDLIVVGAHDRPLLRRLLEPSVTSGVVRESAVPVLVVPDPAP